MNGCISLRTLVFVHLLDSQEAGEEEEEEEIERAPSRRKLTGFFIDAFASSKTSDRRKSKIANPLFVIVVTMLLEGEE